MKKFLIFLFLLCLPLVAEEPVKKKPTAAEVQATTDRYESAFMKTIFVLVAVLVMVVLTIFVFKRLSHTRFSKMNYLKNVKILEKRPLSPKSMLYLIEVGDKQVLLSESQLEVRTLSTLEWPGKESD